MKAHPILLQKKYARIVARFAKEADIPFEKALGVFYHSEVYDLMRNGISDMHCMSDAYLSQDLMTEYKAGISVNATNTQQKIK